MMSNDYQLSTLEESARWIRGKVIEMSHCAEAAHLGSALSCVDILTAIYWTALQIDPKNPTDPKRDRFILSKGHGAAALYATLARRGFFSEDLLASYGFPDSPLEEHPALNPSLGIEAATGSLGHGLSLGLGISLAARIKKEPLRVYVCLSDGECNEGSTWEAALFASAQKLSGLVAVVDYNKWQATGRSDQVMSLAPLAKKWESFGWNVYERDGHDLQALAQTIREISIQQTDKPSMIVAHTTKGKGVSFMEDDNNWHYRVPTANEVLLAHRELGLV